MVKTFYLDISKAFKTDMTEGETLFSVFPQFLVDKQQCQTSNALKIVSVAFSIEFFIILIK